MKNHSKFILLIYLIFINLLLNSNCKKNRISEWTEYDKTDSTYVIRKLVNHKLNQSLSYYKNGKIKIKKVYNNQHNKIFYQEFFANGKLKVEGTLKRGYWVDHYKEFDINGFLIGEQYIKSDSFHGIIIAYHNNGVPRIKVLSDYDRSFYYVAKYDLSYNLESEEGVSFSPSIKCNYPIECIPINRNIEFYIAVADLDDFKLNIKAGKSLDNLKDLEICNQKSIYNVSFEHGGKQKLYFIGSMFRNNGMNFSKDTTILTIQILGE